MKNYWVYILTNKPHGVLYVGVTGDLERRIAEHKTGTAEGFAKRYNLRSLVYCEMTGDVQAAIAREKQIKGWVRAKKIALIENQNPQWRDLAGDV